MVRSVLSSRSIMALLLVYAVGTGSASVQAAPCGHAPHGTVTIDGVTVPDIGPLPTAVPTPATNLNYAAKIDLGKQLYFDGRLSKSNAISCAFCHNPGTGFADARQTSIGVGGGSVVASHPRSIIQPSIPSSFGTAGRARSKNRLSGRFTIQWKWPRHTNMSWPSWERSRAIRNNSSRLRDRRQSTGYCRGDCRLRTHGALYEFRFR